MRRTYVWLFAAALSAFWGAQLPNATAAPVVPTPDGYRLVREEVLHPGVHHLELVKDDGPQRVNVAVVLPGAGARVVPVLSSGQATNAANRLERTSSMCARVACVAAVNADFFDPKTEQSVGGFAVAGELLRSPVGTHHQLFFDAQGKASAGMVSAAVRFVSTDLQELATPQLNVARGDNALVAYTAAFGTSTRTNPHGAELVGTIVKPKGGLRIGQTALVKFTELRDATGDTAIPRDGMVVSGHGSAAEQLRQLWQRMTTGAVSQRVLVRVETSSALTDTVGGAPVLVRDGRRFARDDGTAFFRGRHPRTVVGWTAAGVLLLVTADGRQPGHAAGLTLLEAADLMIGLGSVGAINLDGGGSTTFVTRGQVINRPSDQLVERSGVQRIVPLIRPTDLLVAPVERPTVSALAIVVDTPGPATASDTNTNPDSAGATALTTSTAVDPLVDEVELPMTVNLPAPTATDPASDPSGALPALVAVTTPTEENHSVLELLAATLTIAVGSATAFVWRRQRVVA